MNFTFADLEYQKEHNQDVDGDQLVKALLDVCAAALKVAWPCYCHCPLSESPDQGALL